MGIEQKIDQLIELLERANRQYHVERMLIQLKSKNKQIALKRK